MPVLEAIRSRSYEHRGVRLLEDDAKALRLVELLMARWGVKKISREMNISPHTVRAARRALVIQGKMAPYKQRVVEMMEDAIEAGIERYRDCLENGTVSGAQIPVGLGIIFDKRALAMGEPTSISHAQVSDEMPSEDKINAFLSTIPSANTDSPSIALTPKALQIEANPAADASLDATPVHSSPVPPSIHPSDAGRTDAATPGPAEDPRAEGGGGGVPGPSGP